MRPKAPAPVTPVTPKNLGFNSTEVVPPTPAPVVTVAPKDDVEDEVAAWQAKYSGDIALELAHWIPSLLLVPYITYFFLLDGPRFKRFLVQAIPNAFFEKTLYLFYRVEDQIRRYFQGLLALTALDALCLGIGLWFLGLHEPFLLAVIAAIMRGCRTWAPSAAVCWSRWWRRRIFPITPTCPTKWWDFSSPCGCSMILFSCR